MVIFFQMVNFMVINWSMIIIGYFYGVFTSCYSINGVTIPSMVLKIDVYGCFNGSFNGVIIP
jgi:hypothetical protein